MRTDQLRQILATRGGDWPVRYAREVIGRELAELTDPEVVEVAREMLASAGRRARAEAIGADFKARMQRMGCGCPVMYDNDSRGQRIPWAARVEHSAKCELKAFRDNTSRVESE